MSLNMFAKMIGPKLHDINIIEILKNLNPSDPKTRKIILFCTLFFGGTAAAMTARQRGHNVTHVGAVIIKYPYIYVTNGRYPRHLRSEIRNGDITMTLKGMLKSYKVDVGDVKNLLSVDIKNPDGTYTRVYVIETTTDPNYLRKFNVDDLLTKIMNSPSNNVDGIHYQLHKVLRAPHFNNILKKMNSRL